MQYTVKTYLFSNRSYVVVPTLVGDAQHLCGLIFIPLTVEFEIISTSTKSPTLYCVRGTFIETRASLIVAFAVSKYNKIGLGFCFSQKNTRK